VETLGLVLKAHRDKDSESVYSRIGVFRSAIGPTVNEDYPARYINYNNVFDGCPSTTIKIV